MKLFAPEPGRLTVDLDKYCIAPSSWDDIGVAAAIAHLFAIMEPTSHRQLIARLDAHIAAVEARQTFFENDLLADLHARMDRWPTELLADRVAYEAFRTQLFADLREITASQGSGTEE